MPSGWTPQDHQFMALAIRLARRGLYTTDPNPRVGCVLVKDGQVIAEGWHQRAGESHAEVLALRAAGIDAKESIAYVTLEPCSHYGKTGPCAEALVQAGVSEVVIAMSDPNPQVSGRGIARLQDAGIKVRVGLMEAEAEALNPGFIKRMKQGQPYVRVKMAMSLDGRTAMASGESQWITGPAARADVQRWRARSSAIVTGSGTVKLDDPSLNVREASFSAEEYNPPLRQPVRVVLDSRGELSGQETVFQLPGPSLHASCVGQSEEGEDGSYRRTCLPGDEQGRLRLEDVLDLLAARECNEIWVEAGATLAGAFIKQGLCDELVIYIAPKIMGSNARPLFHLPLDSMSEAHGLKLTDSRQVGADIRLTYQLVAN